MKKLHPGARWFFRFRAYWILFFVVLLFGFLFARVAIGESSDDLSTLAKFVLTFLLFYVVIVLIFGEIFARMSYSRWFYELTDQGLRLEKGIIWKKYSSIPYERIQNVDIHRGIIARLFGFSTLDIHTAGYAGGYGRGRRGPRSEGHIPAVSIQEAEDMRDQIMNVVTKKHGSGL